MSHFFLPNQQKLDSNTFKTLTKILVFTISTLTFDNLMDYWKWMKTKLHNFWTNYWNSDHSAVEKVEKSFAPSSLLTLSHISPKVCKGCKENLLVYSKNWSLVAVTIEHLNTSEWFLSLAMRVGLETSERFALTNVFDLTVLLTFHSLSDFNSCSNWEDKILVALPQCSEPNLVNFHKKRYIKL